MKFAVRMLIFTFATLFSAASSSAQIMGFDMKKDINANMRVLLELTDERPIDCSNGIPISWEAWVQIYQASCLLTDQKHLFRFIVSPVDHLNLMTLHIPHSFTNIDKFSKEEVKKYISEKYGFDDWIEGNRLKKEDRPKPVFLNKNGQDVISGMDWGRVDGGYCSVKDDVMLCVRSREMVLWDYPPLIFRESRDEVQF